jgi:hypothetical protein
MVDRWLSDGWRVPKVGEHYVHFCKGDRICVKQITDPAEIPASLWSPRTILVRVDSLSGEHTFWIDSSCDEGRS